MSLYEALDRFVGTGVLACAALAGIELPETVRLDGAELSRLLRERRQGGAFGAALDTLANAIWHAQEQRGLPLAAATAHATALSTLLDRHRITPALVDQARNRDGRLAEALAEVWLEPLITDGSLDRHHLPAEHATFLLASMLENLIGGPRLVEGLADTLEAYREAHPATADAAAHPPAAHPPAASPSTPPSAGSEPLAVGRTAGEAPVPAIAELRVRPKLPEGARRRFHEILAREPMSAEQRQARLDELAGWLMATVHHLRAASNDPADVRKLKTDAALALESGELETAMDLLKAVREHVRDGRRRAEARIAEELQALRVQMVEEAAATARLGELAMARFDLEQAAEHFADAAGQLPAQETALELGYRYKRAEALAARAEITAESRDIEAAALAYRTCLRLILPERDPASWARVNVGLGDMMLALGVRSAAPVLALEEAAHAYAEAAGAVDRAMRPMQWALVELSHAAALIELGERTDRLRHWRTAAGILLPVLEIFESRGASDLAGAARDKLKLIAVGLEAETTRTALPDASRFGST